MDKSKDGMNSEDLKILMGQKDIAYQRAVANSNTESTLLKTLKDDIDWCKGEYSKALEKEGKLPQETT